MVGRLNDKSELTSWHRSTSRIEEIVDSSHSRRLQGQEG